MTIFDALKYQITDNMPIEDFRAIPEEIREAWVSHPNFDNCYNETSTAAMTTMRKNISLLKKIVTEWP